VSLSFMLWIAYNFLSLQGSLQLVPGNPTDIHRCELLTIFYLYKVLCSCMDLFSDFFVVVNCLQFFIFTRFFAVGTNDELYFSWLWIAYNFLSLQGSLQSFINSILNQKCCELLTIFYLYKVLCSLAFQTSTSFLCCELLTIFYLYKVLCSELHGIDITNIVVNCLQFFIFTRFFAVNVEIFQRDAVLWIAYNFLSLQGSLQYRFCWQFNTISCELLTIFYLYKVLCSHKM